VANYKEQYQQKDPNMETSIKFDDIGNDVNPREFKKFNYVVTVNPESKCGLDGLPEEM